MLKKLSTAAFAVLKETCLRGLSEVSVIKGGPGGARVDADHQT